MMREARTQIDKIQMTLKWIFFLNKYKFLPGGSGSVTFIFIPYWPSLTRHSYKSQHVNLALWL